MSPELIKGEKYSFATDVWSFGVIMYELMYFKRPFEHQNQLELFNKICNEDPQFALSYSTEFINIVKSMLSKDPFMRTSLKKILKHPILINFEDNKDQYENMPEKIKNLEKINEEQKKKFLQLETQKQYIEQDNIYLKQENENLKKEIQELKKENEDIKEQPPTFEEKFKSFENENSNLKLQIQQFSQISKDLQNEKGEIEQKYRRLEIQKTNVDQFYEQSQKRILDLGNENSLLKSQILQLTTQKKELERQLISYQQQHAKLLQAQLNQMTTNALLNPLLYRFNGF
jgi:serine/threonine protein kinase